VYNVQLCVLLSKATSIHNCTQKFYIVIAYLEQGADDSHVSGNAIQAVSIMNKILAVRPNGGG
jgi:hypothetical protein